MELNRDIHGDAKDPALARALCAHSGERLGDACPSVWPFCHDANSDLANYVILKERALHKSLRDVGSKDDVRQQCGHRGSQAQWLDLEAPLAYKVSLIAWDSRHRLNTTVARQLQHAQEAAAQQRRGEAHAAGSPSAGH